MALQGWQRLHGCLEDSVEKDPELCPDWCGRFQRGGSWARSGGGKEHQTRQ